jgi:hypothetical protein
MQIIKRIDLSDAFAHPFVLCSPENKICMPIEPELLEQKVA